MTTQTSNAGWEIARRPGVQRGMEVFWIVGRTTPIKRLRNSSSATSLPEFRRTGHPRADGAVAQ